MRTALSQGDECLLFLGDSRMAAAFDGTALHAKLTEYGVDRCVVNLAIGATDVSGMVMTARRYLSAGRRPLVAVVGKVADSIIDPAPANPDSMVGNNALHLVWSNPGDVFSEVSGFPFANVRAFDDGGRFLFDRSTALGRYQSQVSIRVQRVQNALVSAGPSPQNRFGAVVDMASLEEGLRLAAVARLETALRPSRGSPHFGSWFTRFQDDLGKVGASVVVVELPMPSNYRRQVTETSQAAAYQKWLKEALASRGDSFVDLGRPPWLADSSFADALHLNGSSAARLSADLGATLGPILQKSSGRRPTR